MLWILGESECTCCSIDFFPLSFQRPFVRVSRIAVEILFLVPGNAPIEDISYK